MEIFGGFMVMMSIIGLFLAVIWLIMPFVVFAIKGKQDRSLEILDSIEKRLTTIEKKLSLLQPEHSEQAAPALPPSDDGLATPDSDLPPPDLPLA
jgi:flagellar biogenesis protein FliO